MKIGAIADPPHGLDRSAIFDRTRRLEQAGVQSLWTGILVGESLSTAGYIAALSEKSEIVVGVLNPYTRHPLILARGVAALQRLSNGRAALVLGFGWPPWIRHRFGIAQEDPIGDMESLVVALRDLFSGKTVTCEARGFLLREGRLGGPPVSMVPMYIAAERKRALKLTRSIADGIFLGLSLTPKYVEWVSRYLEKVNEGKRQFEVCSHIEVRLTNDPAKAREELKPDLAYQLAIPEGDLYLERSGFDKGILPKIREALKMPQLMAQRRDPLLAFKIGNMAEATRLIPDEYVDASCIVGSLDHCIERLAEYEKAGLTCAVLSFQDAFESVIPHVSQIVREFCVKATAQS